MVGNLETGIFEHDEKIIREVNILSLTLPSMAIMI